ncbi:hypothetical protein B0H19DRAFT_1085104 [Mycena capillaripes]|nr:hypothetical protein B0H19DRAFT_1085104 [Mycena capillaripes]
MTTHSKAVRIKTTHSKVVHVKTTHSKVVRVKTTHSKAVRVKTTFRPQPRVCENKPKQGIYEVFTTLVMLAWQLVACVESVNKNLQLNAVPRSNNEATDLSTEMVEPRREVYVGVDLNVRSQDEDELKVRWNRLCFLTGPKISGDSRKLLGKLMQTNDTIDICIRRSSSWMCTVKKLVLVLLHPGRVSPPKATILCRKEWKQRGEAQKRQYSRGKQIEGTGS